jgi:adenine-specific DNA-methyltransferase
VALVERLVLSLTNEGDLVVDPYLGAGTTAAAAVLHDRRVAGADIFYEYLEIAKERVIKASLGELKTRPLDKPVYEPNGNSKLTQIPDEWKK